MSKGLVSWCYFYKFAWQCPMKFKESVLPVWIEILGRYCHFLVHAPLEQVITNFVRNEGLSFLLFTSQFIALDTQVCIVFEHSICVFSSPELKAQVSVSDHLSSVVCLSVRLSVCPSVCLSLPVCMSVNFSHFHLLQNHWANFDQTWHNVSLGEGDSSLFIWRATPFPKGW